MSLVRAGKYKQTGNTCSDMLDVGSVAGDGETRDLLLKVNID